MNDPAKSHPPSVSKSAENAAIRLYKYVSLSPETMDEAAIIVQRAIDSETARLTAAQSIAIPEEGVAPDKWMVVGPAYVSELLARAKAAEARVADLESNNRYHRGYDAGEKSVAADRDTARAHAVKLREALKDFEVAERTLDFRQEDLLAKSGVNARAVLALTADSLASLAVVDKEELEQLRKDRERIEVIRRAEWIRDPHTAMSGGEWHVHLKVKGHGQTSACGKSLIHALDVALTWEPLRAAIAAEVKGRT